MYENNFDVPTADLTSTTETKLLTCNAATLDDDSNSSHSITNAGGVTTSTTYVPYAGATSYFFDGTSNSYLTIPASTDFEITATDDYWIEFWVSTVSSDRMDIISAFDPGAPHEGWLVGLGFSGSNPGGIDLWSSYTGGTGTTYTQAGPKINDGKWKHVAVHWGSRVVKVYVNGIYSGQSTIRYRPFYSSSAIYIGRDSNSIAVDLSLDTYQTSELLREQTHILLVQHHLIHSPLVLLIRLINIQLMVVLLTRISVSCSVV